MTKFSRFNVLRLVALSLMLIVPAAAGAQQPPPLAEQVAKSYGIESFEKVEAIRYTFTIPGLVPPRTWEWHPKTDTVIYEGKDNEDNAIKITYKRSDLGSQSDAVKTQIDPAFVNDQYWLLLPFHFVWDGADVTNEGAHETPLGKTSAQRLVAKYAASGYSPGDTWELYIGPDKRVVEMTYHRAVPVPKWPNVIHATWEGNKKAGPLLFSTDHRLFSTDQHGTGDGSDFDLTFTDVAVKLKGSEDWIDAK